MFPFSRLALQSRAPSQQLRRRIPFFERLEDRRMLANIAVVDAYLVNGSGTERLSEAVIGQKIGVRVEWSTSNLPADIEPYQVEFRVNGVPLRSDPGTFGAGSTSFSTWWYRTGWYASPGTHIVEIVVDVDNVVAEADKSDNIFSFEFTPVTANFPQQMIWPLPLVPFTEIFWSNYNDVDPLDTYEDYLGGNATYNGHNGIDARLTSFAAQDAGVPIFAALDGVVSAINEGQFDRQKGFNPSPANYVILDHGDGWESRYWHMRRDSVQVDVGQMVAQGDPLGLVGSSGSSTAPHLHFEVRYRGLPVETYYDPHTYWISPADYVFDNVYLVGTGITNYVPNIHFWEGPSDTYNIAQQSGITLYARGYYSGLRQFDLVQANWYRPNGTFYTTRSFAVSDDYSRSGWYWTNGVNLPSVPDLGTWRVDFLVNNEVLGHTTIEVTPDGAPRMRIEDPDGQIIVNGRFTPIDFGTASIVSSPPTHTFTVVNHGYEDLSIDSMQLPAGFVLVEELSTSIPPGGADTFTVAMDTTIGGYFGGRIKITSNDADAAIYDFAVEGVVSSPESGNLIVGVSKFEINEGEQIVANIRWTGSITNVQIATLWTDQPTELVLPEFVLMIPGRNYAQFFIEVPNDLVIDANTEATIYASADGFHDGRIAIEVIVNQRQPGDFDGDGWVTGFDFLEWQRGMSSDKYTASDLVEWEQHFGTVPPEVAPNTMTVTETSDTTEKSLHQSNGVWISTKFASHDAVPIAIFPARSAGDAPSTIRYRSHIEQLHSLVQTVPSCSTSQVGLQFLHHREREEIQLTVDDLDRYFFSDGKKEVGVRNPYLFRSAK